MICTKSRLQLQHNCRHPSRGGTPPASRVKAKTTCANDLHSLQHARLRRPATSCSDVFACTKLKAAAATQLRSSVMIKRRDASCKQGQSENNLHKRPALFVW